MMFPIKTVAVVGGDVRQQALARRLLQAGYAVRLYGLPSDPANGLFAFSDLTVALCGAAAVVLPLPATADGVHLSLPLAKELPPIKLADLCAAIPRGVWIFGGKLPHGSVPSGRRLVCDYYEKEALQQKNAALTAEGTAAILMRELPRAVAGLPVLITGYGRVGSALADLLLRMGANVTVLARSAAARDAAAARGVRALPLAGGADITAAARECAVAVNTVPALLFDAAVLADLPRELLLIDLASAPGGVCADAAEKAGVRVIFALSLPGKYAPVTAGELIADTILSVLRGEDTV